MGFEGYFEPATRGLVAGSFHIRRAKSMPGSEPPVCVCAASRNGVAAVRRESYTPDPIAVTEEHFQLFA